MPKPFSLQSPEAIAKEYGGNKQKIAQAMQSGIIDPTSGTLAGMFIDRMRSAQMQEMQPQPTIAQQVFAPPAAMPPGGLPPPTGGMGGPQMGAPPMGAPPAAPPEQPGDQTLMMADGGLVGIPVPSTMFDEPGNGGFDDGYAHGGIVAFGTGSPGVVEGGEDPTMDVVSSRLDQGPDQYYSFYRDPEAEMAKLKNLYKPDRTAGTALMDYFGNVMSPEAQKKRASEDKWFALAQLGAKMASTPGSLFQSASAGIQSALPGLQASAKERRAEMRDALVARAQQEGLNNKESLDFAKLTLEGNNKYGEFDEKRLSREQQKRLTEYEQTMANQRTAMQVQGGKDEAKIRATMQNDYFTKQDKLLATRVSAAAIAQLPAMRNDLSSDVGQAHNAYKMAYRAGDKAGMEKAKASIAAAEKAFVDNQVSLALGSDGAGDPALPGAGRSAPVGALPGGGKLVIQNGQRVYVPGD